MSLSNWFVVLLVYDIHTHMAWLGKSSPYSQPALMLQQGIKEKHTHETERKK